MYKWNLELSTKPASIEFPVKAIETLDNGMTRSRYMRIEDTIEALQSIIMDGNNENFLDIPLLPKGTIHFTQSTTSRCMKVLVEFEKSVLPIRYGSSSETFFFGFPRMIASLWLRKAEKENHFLLDSKSKLFAVEDSSKLNSETKLYYFPFPNVYNDGHICWGANRLPMFSSLTDLDRFMSIFTSAPFGEDLGIKVLNKTKNFKEYINQYEEQPFDDDMLLPTQWTLDYLMKN